MADRTTTDCKFPTAMRRVHSRANGREREGFIAHRSEETCNYSTEVIRMKQWKMKMPRRKTDYQKLKQAAEAIGGGD